MQAVHLLRFALLDQLKHVCCCWGLHWLTCRQGREVKGTQAAQRTWYTCCLNIWVALAKHRRSLRAQTQHSPTYLGAKAAANTLPCRRMWTCVVMAQARLSGLRASQVAQASTLKRMSKVTFDKRRQ